MYTFPCRSFRKSLPCGLVQQGRVVRGWKYGRDSLDRHSQTVLNDITCHLRARVARLNWASLFQKPSDICLLCISELDKQIHPPYWLACFISCHASGVTFSLITSYLQWRTQLHNSILWVYMQLQSQFSCQGTKENWVVRYLVQGTQQ